MFLKKKSKKVKLFKIRTSSLPNIEKKSKFSKKKSKNFTNLLVIFTLINIEFSINSEVDELTKWLIASLLWIGVIIVNTID